MDQYSRTYFVAGSVGRPIIAYLFCCGIRSVVPAFLHFNSIAHSTIASFFIFINFDLIFGEVSTIQEQLTAAALR